MKKKLLIVVTAVVCFLTGCANYVKDGTKLLEEEQYQEAIEQFQKAVDKEEDAAEAYRGIGMAYYEQQDYEQARDNLQKALDEGAVQTPAVYNLIGICGMNLEDYDGALAAFEQGVSLSETMEIDGAEEEVDYSEAIREMKYNQIVCCEKKLDWEGAKAYAEAYISAYPDDAEVQKEAEFLRTR